MNVELLGGTSVEVIRNGGAVELLPAIPKTLEVGMRGPVSTDVGIVVPEKFAGVPGGAFDATAAIAAAMATGRIVDGRFQTFAVSTVDFIDFGKLQNITLKQLYPARDRRHPHDQCRGRRRRLDAQRQGGPQRRRHERRQ
jgi:hypothetical protein